LATQILPVSQQPISVATPLHRLLAQHASPAAPQAWQIPPAQTSFTPQVVPAWTQAFPTQQFPPVHCLPAQQISVDAPQVVHAPSRQTLPALLQLLWAATHVSLAGSQHAAAPVQATPLGQQAEPVAPHAEQAP